MKKVFLTLATMLLVSIAANAQYKQNAIGLRLGGGNGFGGEISYQRAIGDNNRLELDLGLRGGRYTSAFRLVGIYQWVWNIEGGFNWYAGFGAGVGAVDYDDRFDRDFPGRDRDALILSIDGQIGIEYVFTEAPIQLGLDLRPAFFVVNDYYGGLDLVDAGLSIRYQFN
jgi:hypothetical protein